MDISIKNSQIYFHGLLNENSNFEQHKEKFLALNLITQENLYVMVDFSDVKRANSCGILLWCKFIKDLNCKIMYVNSPVWLVEQFNMSINLGDSSLVHSFYAPFYCSDSDSYEQIILKLGDNLPILKNYENLDLNYRNIKGQIIEPDFELDEYFNFIVVNYSNFKRFYK